MLYLISGTSRSGKTIIAKKIATQKGIPFLSLDWIMMGFTNGIPEYGIHDKLFPDEIAERLWSFLKAMLESMIFVETDCIIEGEAILPELIVELRRKYLGKLKICFVGYTDINVGDKVQDIKQFSCEKSDWLSNKSDEYIIEHVNNMIPYSRKMKKSCKENNVKYFDISKNFINTIEDTVPYRLELI